MPVQLKKYSHCLGIVTAKRTYYIRAASADDADTWALAINEARKALAEQADEEEAKRRLKEHQHGLGIGMPVTQGSVAPSRQASFAAQSGATAVARASEPLDVALDKMQLADDSHQPVVAGTNADSGLGSGAIAGMQRVARPSPLRTTSSAREPSASSISTADGRVVGGNVSEDLAGPGLSSSDEEDVAFDAGQPSTTGAPALTGAAEMQGTPIQSDPDRVILNGYLMKMGVKRKVWRKRWFVLTSSALMYTKSHMVSECDAFVITRAGHDIC